MLLFVKGLLKEWPHSRIRVVNRFAPKNIFDIYVTEYGTALTTILPILFLYLNTVIVIQPTISLEMPVPSPGHYGFHSFPVDFVCICNYAF